MTLRDWLQQANKKLSVTSSTAQLDAEVLLAHTLHLERSWILAHPDTVLQGVLQGDSLQKLSQYLERRLNDEPIAYIIGSQEFYGRVFEVNAHTLVPRPETEAMIELLLDQVHSTEYRVQSVIDVGTGSGCLGITAVLELQNLYPKTYSLEPLLIDIDEKCIQTAKANAKTHQVEAKFYLGNLLEPIQPLAISRQPLVILANLPYVPDSHTINEAAMHEPKHAIFGGPDGLDLYRNLFAQLKVMHPAVVFTESLPPQHQKLAQIAAEAGYELITEQDFIQVWLLCFQKEHITANI